MSTPPAKEEKPSTLDELKAQASAIAAKIKEATDAHLETLHLKLKDAHSLVESLTEEVRRHSGEPAPAKRRGRKPSAIKSAEPKAGKASKKRKSKRGAVGESILQFLATKGKSGAKVSEIAAAVGNKPANVTAFFYAKGNKAKFKKVAPATFAVAK